MRYTSLRQRPACFRSFTGLTVPEFEELVSLLRPDYQKLKKERLLKGNPKRVRKIGGGRKPELQTLEDEFLLTLVWLRLYVVYLVLEYLFGIDESTVSRVLARILPLLRDKFTLPERLPKKKIKTLEELRKFLPDVPIDSLLGDATEQPILRPEDGRKRKPYHSGKKRRFTAKTQIAVTGKGYILHVSQTVGGKTHDYKLFKKSNLPENIPKNLPSYFDGGYQGIQKDFPRLDVHLPFKRTRGKKELSLSEKIHNKKQRRIRIKVENVLAQFKKFRILAENFRHSLRNYNLIFRFIANLLNFRMLSRKIA